MKSLLINLIVAIFLISCAPTIRPYKEKNCSYILRRQAAIQEEVKQLKATEKYKKETRQLILFSPIIIPLLILLPPGEWASRGNYNSIHERVQNLEDEYENLQRESKYKHCSKEH